MKKILLLSVLGIVACGPIKVQNVPNEIELQKIAEVLDNQGKALGEIVQILRSKGLIEAPQTKVKE